MKYFLLSIILFTAMLSKTNAQSYLPLTGGTLTGNLTISGSTYGLALPGLLFNSSPAQPSTSTVTAIFPNNTSQALDLVGWTNGWHFVPVNTGSYAAPVVSIDQSGNTNIVGNTYIGKNLGIGTTTPGALLSLGNSVGNAKLALFESGYYQWGFGIQNQQFEQYFASDNIANHISWGSMSYDGNHNFTELMRLNGSGNLLIGKTSQTNTVYRIDVNGSVRANAIVVNTNGADFVFDRKYKLHSLIALDHYIKENHHLPNIASAEDMQANGLDVGENQTMLLQKVEELTLYLIAKDKKINQQQRQLDTQEAQIKALETAIQALTNSKIKER